MNQRARINQTSDDKLLAELAALIELSQQRAVKEVNATLNMLFWQVGTRINNTILRNRRGDYGKQIVVTLSRELAAKYGKNFEEKNLRRMLQFADQFSDESIVATLSRHLTWSHILLLLPVKSHECRTFYSNLAMNQNLRVRELRKKIAGKEFERTAVANFQNVDNNPTFHNNFKDPYFLNFLGLQNTYYEKDLEEAILRELEAFILELGRGFAFIERQKRMIIDGDDFHLDLLFYHRKLRRLVAVELKLGKFEAKYKGQMELYLKWLDRYEKKEGEGPPVGLILCAEGSREQVELLEMHKDGIMVAEYWTELPPQRELEKKIHNILIETRERMDRRQID